MKAVVFHAVGDIRLEDVPEQKLKEPTDAIVRLTAAAICGTDLHFVRGTFSGVKKGRILGHEGVGMVEGRADSRKPGPASLTAASARSSSAPSSGQLGGPASSAMPASHPTRAHRPPSNQSGHRGCSFQLISGVGENEL